MIKLVFTLIIADRLEIKCNKKMNGLEQFWLFGWERIKIIYLFPRAYNESENLYWD